jgi:hypothetical protein
MLFGTPDMLKIQQANNKWYEQYAQNNGIPFSQARAYQYLFNQGIGHFKGLIDDIIKEAGLSITVPMKTKYIEDYLAGYSFEYIPFTGSDIADQQVEGYWRMHPTNPNHILIHYKQVGYEQRERYTKVHELLHFMQTLDPMFLNSFDEIIWNSALPPKTIVKLLERLTDRATAMYLMPNDFFKKKYHEIRSQNQSFGSTQLQKLASVFNVSKQSARYRVEECIEAGSKF